MTVKEKVAQAREQLYRAQAIADVYELVSKWYGNEFCEHVKDDEGNYLSDDDGNWIYKEREGTEEDFRLYPWYDGKRFVKAREVMREVLRNIENMK